MSESRRPTPGSTNSKIGGPPTPAQQPGVLSPANPESDPRFGIPRNTSSSRIGERIETQKALEEGE